MPQTTQRAGDTDEDFAAIVIGSGFGGSVTAYRLQEECVKRGLTPGVLLLERGMPYPPRSFARTPSEMRTNFWDPNSALYGLYEVWNFKHSKVVLSSGLGGGSLIYANVLLEKPPESFQITDPGAPSRPWPIDYEAIRGRYESVRSMIGVEELPPSYYQPRDGRPLVQKTGQFLAAARQAGLSGARPAPLAVSFARRRAAPERGVSLGPDNLHGRERRTCTLVGECDLGCNEGAKNSLDFNYLSEFSVRLRGTIRTCCEAVEIADDDSAGYEVRYVQHRPAVNHVIARALGEEKLTIDEQLLDPDPARRERTVRAKVVVVAAGALGSTRLLLASRARLPAMSPQLGRRFSSNGDLLLFARDCMQPAGKRQRDLSPSEGPVITAVAEAGSDNSRLWIEDAGGPPVSEWGWQLGELPSDVWGVLKAEGMRSLRRRLGKRTSGSRVSGELAAALGTARSSAAMLPMLAMGLDRSGGRIRLDRDGLTLSWDPRDSAQHFMRAQKALGGVANALGGKLWPSPQCLRERYWGVTVHPLGGCPMGSDHEQGVVDTNGEVFGCRNLFVADGSVMPGAVGPNPSLTIAAIADHIADSAVERL